MSEKTRQKNMWKYICINQKYEYEKMVLNEKIGKATY